MFKQNTGNEYILMQNNGSIIGVSQRVFKLIFGEKSCEELYENKLNIYILMPKLVDIIRNNTHNDDEDLG